MVGTFGEGPLSDVTIDFGSSGLATSDADGTFSASLPVNSIVYYEASKSGYMTQRGTWEVDGTEELAIDLIHVDHPDFDLRAYKRILFDDAASAPSATDRFGEALTLYVDETPDDQTGQAFSESHIDRVLDIASAFVSAITDGAISEITVQRGFDPPSSNVIVYQVDSSTHASAAAGGCGFTCKVVSFREPSFTDNEYLITHETGHAIGFNHTNGAPSLMTSNAIFYTPNDEFISRASATAFDSLAGKILYSRPAGTRTAVDIDDAVEFVASRLPVLASPRGGQRPLSFRDEIVFLFAADGDTARDYEVQLSDGPSFDSAADNILAYGVGNKHSARVDPASTDGLWEEAGVLYWRVVDRSTGLVSEIDSFATSYAAPGAPPLLLPGNDTRGYRIDGPLVWRSPAGASTYHLQVSTTEDFTDLVFEDSTLVHTAAEPGPLEHDTKYFWRVRASNASGAGPWSEVYFFTTIMGPPSAVTLTSPVDGASDQALPVRFEWEPAPAATYHLQVATEEGFESLLFEDSTLVQTSQEVDVLQPETLYFWRVRARNAAGAGAWSEASRFTTARSNAAPTVEQPIDDVELLAGHESAVLELQTVFSDADGDTLRYDAASSHAEIASPIVTGHELRIVGHAAGTTSITVTADDGRGGSATTSFTVDVAENVGVERAAGRVPDHFSLGQNYPNPVTGTTTIALDLPLASTVRLTVYDALGRTVKRLVSGTYPAGTFTIMWDASDLPNGIYVYRVEARRHVQAKTLVVQK